MKMSLTKLIANDIINYGMNDTTADQYIVYLDSYLDDFDEESKKYILDNLDQIVEDVRSNDKVCDLEYDKKDKSFDMIFYWDCLFNPVDELVMNVLKEKEMGEKIRIYEVKGIAQEVLEDEGTKNLAYEKILNYHTEYELWN